ncbi:MAG: ribosome biogenesis GTPase Der [Eubacteriales bacterium]
MSKPIVAVVGRPNVGKSTLFNRLAEKRISIVEDTPGVTRDRIYADCEWLNKHFTLIDTGGIEPYDDDIILKQMYRQAEIALDTADVILFLVDGKEGITAVDRDIANIIRKKNTKTLLVCNKIDKHVLDENIYDFYELGLGEPIAISAAEGLGIGDLLDEVMKKFNKLDQLEEESIGIKVAVIGKPNVGKSSIVNRIFGEERVIVSEIPGTTRDAIDTEIEINENKYIFIDTAGIRKKNKIYQDIERYSVIRSFTAIERSDICLLVIDGEKGVSEQDTKIAGYAIENGKSVIIIVNKWDLVEKQKITYNKFIEDLYRKLSFMVFCPVITVSALTGQRMNKIIDKINEVNEYRSFRIKTGVLNDVINDAVLMNQPRSVKGKRLKIFYASQVSINPPRFLIFVNNRKLVHFSYTRYIENKLRENFIFEGTPIIISYRNRGD